MADYREDDERAESPQRKRRGLRAGRQRSASLTAALTLLISVLGIAINFTTEQAANWVWIVVLALTALTGLVTLFMRE
jgi:membrane protein YdbS with pleckstrin-like domain